MCRKMLSASLVVSVFVIACGQQVLAAQDLKPGLAGTYYNGREFTEPDRSVDFLKHVQQDWKKSRGNDWSDPRPGK